jgi:di/tricarboxylate transporter
MDGVALIMLTSMPAPPASSPLNEALAGFSDPSIVPIGAVSVIGAGLTRTGIGECRLGDWLNAKAGSWVSRLIVLLMGSVAALGIADEFDGRGGDLHSGGAAHHAKAAEIAPGRLMMPLSMAALISGMLTLVATTPI